MRIILARPAGFCGGVKRAVDQLETVLNVHRRDGVPVYGFHYPVHNTHVIRELEALGLIIINRLSDIQKKGILAISAHGVSPSVIEEATSMGMEVLDTTCPKVSQVQRAASRLYQEGYRVFILGDPNHAEVKGIAGWCGGRLEVIEGEGALPAISPDEKIGLIAQTTQNEALFQKVAEAIGRCTTQLLAINTICAATQNRQKAALELAEQTDVLLVIGDPKSANTRRLTQLCESHTRTFQIQEASDIEPTWFTGVNTVGVTAGASTPQRVIDEVIDFLERL